MKRVVVRILMPGAALLLGACSANSYCLKEQDYQAATVVPELKPADGLDLPQSAGALRLPPAPATFEPFGRKDDHGHGVCLDQPPRMTTPARPERTPQPPAKVSSAS